MHFLQGCMWPFLPSFWRELCFPLHMFPYNLCNGPEFHFTRMTLKGGFFLSILHSMHYNSVTIFPATKCTPQSVSMTPCWRLALQYICCVLSLLWHSVSFLLCTSSCHSSFPAFWQWQFSQISLAHVKLFWPWSSNSAYSEVIVERSL